MRASLHIGCVSLTILFALGCGARGASSPAEPASEAEQDRRHGNEGASGGGGKEGLVGGIRVDEAPSPVASAPARAKMAAIADGEAKPDSGKDIAAGQKEGEKGGGPEVQVRQWFPEAFLWQPLVETDLGGKATVDLRVPDQLTTWRVLGLAHDRSGRQAGATTTIDSRLALYADPVVPAWLYAGDVLDLPVQLVNSTSTSATGTLDVTASGALNGGGTSSVSLGAGASDVRRVRLTATGAGTGQIRVDLSGTERGDSVIREFPVLAQGRPVLVERGGGLSGSRTFVLDGPDESDPSTRSVDVRVFAGPLSLMGAEFDRLDSSGIPDGAYAFALGARVASMPSVGMPIDPKRLRAMQWIAWQKVVRESRNPDAGVAADLLVGVGAVTGNELIDALRPRLIRSIVDGQRGDGTFSRRAEAPLQEVIVQTAWVARALPVSEETARKRAAGALERFAPEVRDPYTASMVLSTGLVKGARAEILKKILADGLVKGVDGAIELPTPSNVVDPGGVWPSRAEVLSAAILVLEPGAARDDLVGTLLADWSGAWGFGAGHADPMALEAVVSAMPALTQKVEVVLTIDGHEVSRSPIDPTQPYQPAVLSGIPLGSDPSIELHTEPSLPGLAYSASLRSYVPWSGTEGLAGVEATVELSELAVGQESWLVLELAAPSGARLVVEQGLAPGTSVDEARLSLPTNCTLDVVGDRIRVTTGAFGAGEIQTIRVPVRPSLPGRFTTTPLVLSAAGEKASVRPMVWNISPEGGS